MRSTSTSLLKLGQVTMVVALMLTVSACEKNEDTPGKDAVDTTKNDGRTTTYDENYLPYSIKFLANGTPIVVDRDQNPVQLNEVKTPLKSTAITSVQAMSTVIYEGSCKMVIMLSGKLYEVVLPDIYCRK